MPESAVSGVFLLEAFCGVPIQFIKLIHCINYRPEPSFAPLFSAHQSFLVVGFLLIDIFLGRSGFTSVSKVAL